MSKKVLLKKLIKFTGKHLTRVFFNKAAGSWILLYFSFAQTVILKIGNAANLKEMDWLSDIKVIIWELEEHLLLFKGVNTSHFSVNHPLTGHV